MLETLCFCCPKCRGALKTEPEKYICPACPREYPIVYGIPDFRLFPDPYISFEDEVKKAGVVVAQADQGTFADLVRFYWQITPDVPAEAVERYVRYAVSGVERGKACIETAETYLQQRWSGEACLEIGCGTGGFLLAAQDRFRTVVGVDIALRWLVIAKKRMEETGGNALLVCCSAEHLPFPDETFDSVVATHTLEHTGNQQAVLNEMGRALKRDGFYLLSTPNRYSLGPEPCVRVWGVGFLPRSLASPYVRLFKGVPYRFIRLVSCLELRRLLNKAGLRKANISPPRFAECELKAVSERARRLIGVYHALMKLPGFSAFLKFFGPMLQVTGRK